MLKHSKLSGGGPTMVHPARRTKEHESEVLYVDMARSQSMFHGVGECGEEDQKLVCRVRTRHELD